MNEAPDRPVLKYNGGKWLDGKWIISHFPEHRIFADLFGGGGSVILQKPRAKIEYYNDLDSQVYTFFKVLRDRPKELIRSIRFTPYSREVFEREVRQPTDDDLEIARRFAARCWLNHGNNNKPSGFRNSGNLYVPGGYEPAGMFANVRPYYQAALRLRGVVIENTDWFALARKIDGPETLLYIDPPYLGGVRYSSRLYNCEMSSEEDHIAFISNVKSLRSMIIISGYESDLYRGGLSGWRIVTKKTRDNSRRERTEALFISPNCEATQPNLFDFG